MSTKAIARARPATPQKVTWRPVEITAIHEAAHACIGHYLGRTPTKFRLWVEPVGENDVYSGQVTPPPADCDVGPDGSDVWDRHEVYAQAIIVLAGKAAEDVIESGPCEYYGKLEVVQDGKLMATDAASLAEWIDRLDPPDELRQLVIDSLKTAAENVVRGQMPAIMGLAAAALKRIPKRAVEPWSVTIESDELRSLLESLPWQGGLLSE